MDPIRKSTQRGVYLQTQPTLNTPAWLNVRQVQSGHHVNKFGLVAHLFSHSSAASSLEAACVLPV